MEKDPNGVRGGANYERQRWEERRVGRKVIETARIGDIEEHYGQLCDKWDQMSADDQDKLLSLVKLDYKKAFKSAISPFDFLELAIENTSGTEMVPQYTIREIGLDAACAVMMRQHSNDMMTRKANFMWRGDRQKPFLTGKKAELLAMEVMMDKMPVEEEQPDGGIITLAKEGWSVDVIGASPVDDYFNGTDGYLVIRNEKTGESFCIAFDITINSTDDVIKEKLDAQHLYGFNSIKRGDTRQKNLSEGGYRTETGFSKHAYHHRDGLHCPGFTVAKYFKYKNNKGKKFIIPKLVIGCDALTMKRMKKSLDEIKRGNTGEFANLELAKSGFINCGDFIKAEIIRQCMTQVNAISSMIDRYEKDIEKNGGRDETNLKDVVSEARRQIEMATDYFNGLNGDLKGKLQSVIAAKGGRNCIESTLLSVLDGRNMGEAASSVCAKTKDVYYTNFNVPSASDRRIGPWGVAELKIEGPIQ